MSLDWAGLLRQGARDLRLPPDQFWALTPFEFSLLRGDPPPGAGMSGDALAALMRRFPDAPTPETDP